MSSTPLPSRLPPKLPIDCMPLTKLFCSFRVESMASASVAMSCVAEAMSDRNTRMMMSWMLVSSLSIPAPSISTAYTISDDTIQRL